IAQALVTWTLAVVMIPPVHCPLFVRAMHSFRLLEVILGFASCRRLSGTGHHEVQADVHRRQARTTSKLKRTTTRHDSPVLIFDELEYEPFTENHRWPSGDLKIARRRPPATPAITKERATRARLCAKRSAGVHTRLS